MLIFLFHSLKEYLCTGWKKITLGGVQYTLPLYILFYLMMWDKEDASPSWEISGLRKLDSFPEIIQIKNYVSTCMALSCLPGSFLLILQ